MKRVWWVVQPYNNLSFLIRPSRLMKMAARGFILFCLLALCGLACSNKSSSDTSGVTPETPPTENPGNKGVVPESPSLEELIIILD